MPVETLKSYAALVIQKLCQRIDGALTEVFTFCVEMITFLVRNNRTCVERSEKFIMDTNGAKFYQKA